MSATWLRNRPEDVFPQFRAGFLSSNVDQIVDLYLDESTFFDVDGEVSGLADIRKKFEGFFSVVQVTEYEVLERHEVAIDGDYAYATMRFRSLSKLINDSSTGDIESYGRSSEVLKRVDGRWYFVVDHASFPIRS